MNGYNGQKESPLRTPPLQERTTPTFKKSVCSTCSRESVRSGHHCCPCQAGPTLVSSYGGGGSGGLHLAPAVLVTGTSSSGRMIRQSSQPEAAAQCCYCSGCSCPMHLHGSRGHLHTPSAASLRQLREPGDGIAGIAADSLRINGGIRQFRQVSFALSPLRGAFYYSSTLLFHPLFSFTFLFCGFTTLLYLSYHHSIDWCGRESARASLHMRVVL